MNSTKRRLEIYNKVITEKRVFIQELADMYKVSPMTIRRDLSILEKQRVVTMIYRGAYLNDGAVGDLSFDLSKKKMKEEKLAIAYEASKYIKDGDSVYIGCGTTCHEITRFIKNERMIITTNSTMVVQSLEGKDKIDIVIVPGKFNRNSRAFFGTDSIDYIRKYYFDVAFLSPKYFDIYKGATVIDDYDAKLNEAVIASSRRVYLLVDSEKFGKVSFVKYADSSAFDIVLTDDKIDPTYVEQCKENLISIVIAQPMKKRDSVKISV